MGYCYLKAHFFVDATYGNEATKRQSTTGYAFTYSGGAVVYQSKLQLITAISSTKAEFIDATTAAKTPKYIQMVLTESGFPQKEPTPIYEVNKTAIEIMNLDIPTKRTCHMDIRFFALQDWKTRDEIVLHLIPGVVNPADDLTKPLRWVLHTRHNRYIMGHYDK